MHAGPAPVLNTWAALPPPSLNLRSFVPARQRNFSKRFFLTPNTRFLLAPKSTPSRRALATSCNPAFLTKVFRGFSSGRPSKPDRSTKHFFLQGGSLRRLKPPSAKQTACLQSAAAFAAGATTCTEMSSTTFLTITSGPRPTNSPSNLAMRAFKRKVAKEQPATIACWSFISCDAALFTTSLRGSL